LAEIDPRRIHANPLAASIIDRVNIDDQDVPPASGSSLSVPAGRHRLKIYYTLPEFRIPRRIRFRYRLDGWDKDWIQADNLRDATYTGITPGDYTFHVAHSDGYGNWSSAESALSIRVMPYFYQTSWFLTVIALLIAICISQLHRLRVAQVTDGINARMRERLQERTRIARELHDTLLQGMLGVSMQMYAASQQPHSNLWVLTLLSQASQRLRELAEDGRRAVDELRAPSAVPASLETILTLAVTDMNLRQMESKINSVGTRMELHPLVQREIEKIALEAIANAARHSGAKVIRLDITYQPAHFFLSISDDGCGISQETLTAPCPGHWGILGMRERAASIGSRLRILPHVPSGTVVEISLLGAIAYLDPPHSGIRTIWYRLRRRSHSHSFNARTQEKDQSDDQIA